MSLILEALKKSEAERQRRQPPGLLTPTSTPQRRRPWRWLAILALLPITLVGGWWLGQRGSDLPDLAVVAPPPRAEAIPAPAVDTPRPAALGVPDLTPPPAPDLPARRLPPPAQPTTDNPRAVLREGLAMLAPSSPDPLADTGIGETTRAGLQVPSASPPVKATTRNPPTTSRQRVAATPLAPAPDAPETAPPSGPPQIFELPYTLRRDIPEIRVSMLVSSGDASARFALVNGERRYEGDEVAPDVRLIEIRAQAIELEFRGQRFLLRQGSL